MDISTVNELPGATIKHTRGLATGEVVIGGNVVSTLFSNLGGTQGLAKGSPGEELILAREKAIDELKKDAKRLGGNSLIGVSVSYLQVNGERPALLITATGTAVVAVRQPSF